MFIHLHTHSYYSFLDGIPSPQQLVQAAVGNKMPALALTDHHGLTGAIEFVDDCHQAGIKPILGLELTVVHRLGKGNLVLLAKGRDGWASLCRLSSAAQTAPHRDPTQGISFDQLDTNTKGLICLSGGKGGLLSQLVARGQPQAGIDFLSDLNVLFSEDLYIELQIQRPADKRSVEALAALAQDAGFPLVATNNVHYLSDSDTPLQRTLSAMRLNCTLSQLPPEAQAPAGCTFTSVEEMKERFADYPEAIANTMEIADRCNLELPLDQKHYPAIALPSGKSAMDILRQRARRGAKGRYGQMTATIEDRLEHELAIIAELDYAPIFLIMAEIIDYARQEQVPTASRGSAGSSLVAHCLGITTPDPIALNLYFERFLNPSRKSPPDIDTDLCSRRRHKVIQHVYDRYGEDRVAMVATINRFRRRSALREVAKVHGLEAKTIKVLTARLPYRSWGPRGRSQDNQDDPYRDLVKQYPAYDKIFQQAAAILNFPRHLSVHPGGVVIAPGHINDLLPTHLASKGVIITQMDLEAVERMGLVKIDLLGTRGLSVLGDVAEKVHQWHLSDYDHSLDVLDAIPEDDPETAEVIRSAETIGCFGIESPGMRATLKEIDAHTPEDIMIALALYRPGPLKGGLKDAFVRRHLGLEPVEHLHPALSELLHPTHGVILYQEQVLRIASQLAGLSLAEADILRRAMSHFDPGKRMKTLREQFITGAEQKSGVPAETGAQIWDLMAAFAGYGFPKAHAASYAEVAWRSTWCKVHYPAAFMAAVLANGGGYYRQRVYLNETRRMGITLKPPHINHADHRFRVAYPQGIPTLYMGLNQVKGLTFRTQKRIISGRPFSSLDDFLTRVDPRRDEAESLIKVGALGGLGTIPGFLDQIQATSWRYRQPSLFEISIISQGEEWDLPQQVAAQEAILGIGVDAHPLEVVADQVAQTGGVTTSEAVSREEDAVRVVGICQTLQRFHTPEEQAFYILELEDQVGVLNVFLTPQQRNQYRSILSSRQPLVVEGSMDLAHSSGEPVLRCKNIEPLK
jgi:DNA-directed DNA polymerase III PolC